jgi:hypothetical protein
MSFQEDEVWQGLIDQSWEKFILEDIKKRYPDDTEEDKDETTSHFGDNI